MDFFNGKYFKVLRIFTRKIFSFLSLIFFFYFVLAVLVIFFGKELKCGQYLMILVLAILPLLLVYLGITNLLKKPLEKIEYYVNFLKDNLLKIKKIEAVKDIISNVVKGITNPEKILEVIINLLNQLLGDVSSGSNNNMNEAKDNNSEKNKKSIEQKDGEVKVKVKGEYEECVSINSEKK